MNDITQLLERATADLPSTGPDLVAGAVARGRRRRRRHLAATALGSVAVVAVAALATTSGAEPTLPERSVVATDPGPTASSAPTAAPTTAPTSAPRRFGMDPTRTGAVLGSLLDGTITQPRSWSERPDVEGGFQAGSVLLDGAQVTILLERTTLARCGEQPPLAACDSVGNGFLSTSTYSEPGSGGGATGVVTNSATLYTADHVAITATAYNAAAEKDSAPILERPVLTVAELADLVQDPVWLEQQP